jgi:hypothetical protein
MTFFVSFVCFVVVLSCVFRVFCGLTVLVAALLLQVGYLIFSRSWTFDVHGFGMPALIYGVFNNVSSVGFIASIHRI